MRRSWTPLLGLVACMSGGNGAGSVGTSPDAPWSLDGARSFLWAPYAGNDGRSGDGVLIISTEDLVCEDLTTAWYDDESGALTSGSGLIFMLQYYTDRDRDSPAPAWDGLYLGGYSYNLDTGDEREMMWAAFNESTLWVAGYYGGGGWLRVDEGTEQAFRGEFNTSYWSGSFNAEICDPIGDGEPYLGDGGYFGEDTGF